VINAGKDSRYHLKRLGEFGETVKTDMIGDMNNLANQRAETLIGNLIRFAETDKSDRLDSRLKSLWISDESFDKHIVKRKGAGDILDEMDYAKHTFDVLSSASIMKIAINNDERLNSGKFQVASSDWAVLVSESGKIVTSYPFDPNKSTFEQNHERVGDKIHEHTISRANREILKRVFSRD
jgi:hypothetical protein